MHFFSMACTELTQYFVQDGLVEDLVAIADTETADICQDRGHLRPRHDLLQCHHDVLHWRTLQWINLEQWTMLASTYNTGVYRKYWHRLTLHVLAYIHNTCIWTGHTTGTDNIGIYSQYWLKLLAYTHNTDSHYWHTLTILTHIIGIYSQYWLTLLAYTHNTNLFILTILVHIYSTEHGYLLLPVHESNSRFFFSFFISWLRVSQQVTARTYLPEIVFE